MSLIRTPQINTVHLSVANVPDKSLKSEGSGSGKVYFNLRAHIDSLSFGVSY